ncbi:MAG TPA: DUF5946 family protein [Actinomycetes bacterium]|jgi:hypothetical protein|nr:DUF5946 family protein [Actinomycetes bacterium]
MSGWTTCPGCGLELPASGSTPDPRRNASPECWQLFGEVQGFELNHIELVRDDHQLAVAAYAAQHASRDAGGDIPPTGVAYALVGLHLALDRGVPGVRVRAAHQRMGRPDASWPRLPAPTSTGAVTVFDVATAGAMVDSVAAHAQAVRAWAAVVWQAWAAQHAAVAALAGRLLR